MAIKIPKRNEANGSPRGMKLATLTLLLGLAAALCVLPACASNGPNDALDAPEAPGAPGAPTLPQLPPRERTISGVIPFGSPATGIASGRQDHAAVAFNGSQHLVVWADERAGDWRAYGARVLPDGTVLDPVGIPIATEAWDPDVASDGDGFLVVCASFRSDGSAIFSQWRDGPRGIRAVRLSASGEVLSTSPLTVEPLAFNPRVTFDGTNYVVVWEQTDSKTVFRARVTPLGDVLDPDGILTASGRNPDVDFNGTSSLITYVGAHQQIVAKRVDPSGVLLDPVPLPVGPDDGSAYHQAVGCGNGVCTVLWSADASPRQHMLAARITASGTVLDANPIEVFPDPFPDDTSRSASVAYDGTDAVLVWDHPIESESVGWRLHSARLDPQGNVNGHVVVSEAAGNGAVAVDGASALVVFTERTRGSGISGRRVGHDGAPIDNGSFPIALSANGEIDPAVAWTGERFVVAWNDDRDAGANERSNIYAAGVSAQGEALDAWTTAVAVGPSPQFAPRVSALGGGALITWWDANWGTQNAEIYGARLSPEGAVLDPAALWFGSILGWQTPLARPQAMLSSGDSALVGWSCPGSGACVAHVPEIGAPAALADLDTGSEVWFSSSFDGVNHLVVWGAVLMQHNPEVRNVRAALMTPAGAILGDPAGFPIAPGADDNLGLSAVFDGVNHVIVWLDITEGAPGLRAVRVALDGTVLDPAAPMVVPLPAGCDALAFGPAAAAYDGSSTVVAFRGCGPSGIDVLGVTLDANLVAGPIFAISDDVALDGVPALASDGAGTTLAVFSSFRAEAPFGSRRVIAHRLTY